MFMAISYACYMISLCTINYLNMVFESLDSLSLDFSGENYVLGWDDEEQATCITRLRKLHDTAYPRTFSASLWMQYVIECVTCYPICSVHEFFWVKLGEMVACDT